MTLRYGLRGRSFEKSMFWRLVTPVSKLRPLNPSRQKSPKSTRKFGHFWSKWSFALLGQGKMANRQMVKPPKTGLLRSIFGRFWLILSPGKWDKPPKTSQKSIAVSRFTHFWGHPRKAKMTILGPIPEAHKGLALCKLGAWAGPKQDQNGPF